MFIEKLFVQPYISVNLAAQMINASYPTANTLVQQFAEAGFLAPIAATQRNRIYGFRPYLDILRQGTGELADLVDGDGHATAQAGQEQD